MIYVGKMLDGKAVFSSDDKPVEDSIVKVPPIEQITDQMRQIIEIMI